MKMSKFIGPSEMYKFAWSRGPEGSTAITVSGRGYSVNRNPETWGWSVTENGRLVASGTASTREQAEAFAVGAH
jgi:hypothetical protein